MQSFKEWRRALPQLESKIEKEKLPELETHGMHREKSVQSVNEAHTSSTTVHSEERPSSLSNSHTDALQTYTGEGYKSVNEKLFGRDNFRRAQEKKIRDHIATLDSALESHKTKKDMHVYSGIKADPSKAFKAGQKSTVFHHPSYMSTSTEQHVAQSFGGRDQHSSPYKNKLNVLKLHIPAGTHAQSVRHLSHRPREDEVLLHRDHHIEIDHEPAEVSDNHVLWNARVVAHAKRDLKWWV